MYNELLHKSRVYFCKEDIPKLFTKIRMYLSFETKKLGMSVQRIEKSKKQKIWVNV